MNGSSSLSSVWSQRGPWNENCTTEVITPKNQGSGLLYTSVVSRGLLCVCVRALVWAYSAWIKGDLDEAPVASGTEKISGICMEEISSIK